MKLLFEIKRAKQMEIYHQELKLVHEAGFTGRGASQAALELAGKKVKTSISKKKLVNSQLKWNFGKPDLQGQCYFKLGD